MSHANGEAKFSDGTVMHFEYNGTSDVCRTALKPTYEEMQKDWRKPGNDADCKCGQPSEIVELSTDYGGGFSWPGKACRKCMAITDGLMPFDSDCDVKWRNRSNALYR